MLNSRSYSHTFNVDYIDQSGDLRVAVVNAADEAEAERKVARLAVFNPALVGEAIYTGSTRNNNF